MEQWLDIRRRVLREGVSKRQILRETGMHWTTLEKILEHPSPPGYRRNKRPERPKIDPYVDRIREILAQDQHIHKKQRHSHQPVVRASESDCDDEPAVRVLDRGLWLRVTHRRLAGSLDPSRPHPRGQRSQLSTVGIEPPAPSRGLQARRNGAPGVRIRGCIERVNRN